MDDRLIVALDVPNAVAGLDLAGRLGDAVGFYKIGLGMLTGGGLALANELKQDHGKRIFLDMKLFDIGATVEAAVRGLAQFDLVRQWYQPHLEHRYADAVVRSGDLDQLQRIASGYSSRAQFLTELTLDPPVNAVLPVSRGALQALWAAFGES